MTKEELEKFQYGMQLARLVILENLRGSGIDENN